MYYLNNFKTKNDFYKFVSQRMSRIRTLTGYTQEYIAENIDMTVGNYSKLERANSKCSLYTLFKFVDTLNIKIDDFFLLNDVEFETLIQKHASSVSKDFVYELEKAFDAIIQTYKINTK